MNTLTISARGLSLDFNTPKVMGVLNVTPDSFSDGGLFIRTDSALARIAEMLKQGASIIDIGGESTRPGADPVNTMEELRRVMPLIEAAITEYPSIIFSIDTTKYEVAEAALHSGVHMVNDVSGLQKEPKLAELCALYGAALVIMHSRGDPKSMQKKTQYNDVVKDVARFLADQAQIALNAGVKEIIIDPGIGFGKTTEHNLKLIAALPELSSLGYPMLIGASRKSLIGSILNGREASGRLAGTIALHYHALTAGAKILRVHDVQEAFDSILIYNAIKTAQT